MRMWLVVGLGIVLGLATWPKLRTSETCQWARSAIPKQGFEYAPRGLCRRATPSRKRSRPIRRHQGSKDVANTPGMTPTALMVWLQDAQTIRRCPTSVDPRSGATTDVAAYVLSLKD